MQAQSQLDSIAAAMASGAVRHDDRRHGRDVGRAERLRRRCRRPARPATRSSINYTDSATNTQHSITLVRVDDPSAAAAAEYRHHRSERQGGRHRFFRRHGLGRSRRSTPRSPRPAWWRRTRPARRCACSTTAPATPSTSMRCRRRRPRPSLTGGACELPFFTDGSQLYTGAITSFGSQSVGLAGRIAVNAALDRRSVQARRLSGRHGGRRRHAAELPLRPADQRLADLFADRPGSARTARRSAASLGTYLRQMISVAGRQRPTTPTNLQAGPGRRAQLAAAALQRQRSASISTRRWPTCSTLQNSYAANARVMSAVKDMIDTLMQM